MAIKPGERDAFERALARALGRLNDYEYMSAGAESRAPQCVANAQPASALRKVLEALLIVSRPAVPLLASAHLAKTENVDDGNARAGSF